MLVPIALAIMAWMAISPQNEQSQQQQQQQQQQLALQPTHEPIRKVNQLMNRNLYMIQTVSKEPNSIVWIDFENVRGKAGFQLSHLELIKRISVWTNFHNLDGKVSLIVDHGAKECGYYIEEERNQYNHLVNTYFASGISIVFAGPNQTADDAIVQDIGLFTGGTMVVVTADALLRRRCGRQAQCPIHIINPEAFLDDLDVLLIQLQKINRLESSQRKRELPPQLNKEEQIEDYAEVDADQTDKNNNQHRYQDQQVQQQLVEELQGEIKLKTQILETRRLLRRKRITNKRRKSLEYRLQILNDKISKIGPSKIAEVISIKNDADDHENNHQKTSMEPTQQRHKLHEHGKTNERGISTEMTRDEQDSILSIWQKTRNQSRRREGMGDRQVLAERLRRHLVEITANTSCTSRNDEATNNSEDYDKHRPAKAHVNLVNRVVTREWLQKKSKEAVTNTGDTSTIIHKNTTILNIKSDKSITAIDTMNAIAISSQEKKAIETDLSSNEDETSRNCINNDNDGDISKEMIVTVGGGLDCGMALFTNHGELVRYEPVSFKKMKDIEDSAIQVIQQWVEEYQQHEDKELSGTTKRKQISQNNQQSRPWKVTYLAIGKNGRDHRNSWARVASSSSSSTLMEHCFLISVSMTEWRTDVLTVKELSSGSQIQREAIGLIARQIIANYGITSLDLHKGKLKPSVAEAIVFGFYIAYKKLGWIFAPDPPISRYSNGKVVVPTQKEKN